jgi:hypothetical protein
LHGWVVRVEPFGSDCFGLDRIEASEGRSFAVPVAFVNAAHLAEPNHPPFYASCMSGKKSPVNLTGSRETF